MLAQTLADWECIVVDDGSPDAVAEIAQEYADRDPRIRLLRQKNAGVAAARNAGYAAASQDAEFVIFQDSDDVWTPDALAVLAAALDAHPDAAGAHGLADRIGPDGGLLEEPHADIMRERYGYERKLTRLRADQPTTLDSLVTKFKMYPPGIVLVRRPLVARAGLWTEDRCLARLGGLGHVHPHRLFRPHRFRGPGDRRLPPAQLQHDRPRLRAPAAPPGHPAPPGRRPRQYAGAVPPGAPGGAGLGRGRLRPAVAGAANLAPRAPVAHGRQRPAPGSSSSTSATVASDLDLRLHRLRRRFRQRPPPRRADACALTSPSRPCYHLL